MGGANRGQVLALVLAGGAGGRMGPLTETRAKPSLPFAGVYRLVDFPLSNCHHSRISDVWVIQQFHPRSLVEHLANGRPWDLDRTYGGLRVVHPYLGRDEGDWYKGNADALYRHRADIEEFAPETLVVLSADQVYLLDYSLVVAEHRARDAEVTVVTTRVDPGEASRFGVVQADADGRVTGFEYKPDEPRGDVVTAEVFVYDAETLLATLGELGAGGELGDFGDDLLPRLVERGRAYEHRLDGYWRDVGTIESYWRAHMDLVGPEPPVELGDPAWPILTRAPQRPPARIAASAHVEASLVSPGASVSGRVVRSVLGPGVVVHEGADVRDSVLLDDVTVGAGGRLDHAIVDAGMRVEGEARGSPDEPEVVAAEEELGSE